MRREETTATRRPPGAGTSIVVGTAHIARSTEGRRSSAKLGFCAAILSAACSAHSPPKVDGCGSDKDCKLERICERGQCVWPAVPTAKSASAPAAAATPVAAPKAADAAAQSMFRFDPHHRGRSPFLLPKQKPAIRWARETSAPITSSPTLSNDGLVLGASHNNKVLALSKDGKTAWSFSTGDLVWSTPAIAASGTVYVGSDDDNLYALDGKTGKLLWKYRVGSCQQTIGIGPEATRCDVDGGPTIGPDGTIYTGGDAVYAVQPNGSLRWRFPTGGHVSGAPAVADDGTVYAGSQDNSVYAIAPDGRRQWEFRARDDVESSPAIEEDGTIYVGSDDHRLYALSPQGQLLWAFTTGDDVRASAAIGRDGTVYIGSFDGLLYAIRRDGTLLWAFRAGDRIVSSALVDAAGAILFGSQDDRLYALEPDGKLRWSVELGGDVDSSPILDADGTIYVGADDGKLYALKAP